MSFWNQIDNSTLSMLLPRIGDALRDCRHAMQRFANLGITSNKLAAAYPQLRQLRAVIRALDTANRDGQSEAINRRRTAIGVPIRNVRHRKSSGDYDGAHARSTASREIEVARRHVGNAVRMLRKHGNPGVVTQLQETAQFLAIARDVARRE
jgi:hypothetical protein